MDGLEILIFVASGLTGGGIGASLGGWLLKQKLAKIGNLENHMNTIDRRQDRLITTLRLTFPLFDKNWRENGGRRL